MDAASPERLLGEFVSGLSAEDVPDAVVRTVVRAFVDTVGVSLAGSVHDAGRIAATLSGVDPDRAGASTLLGRGPTESPADAALRIGTAAHALDYDDLSWAMDGHPSVTLVPPLLALAGDVAAAGADLVAAYVAGFETACSVAAPVSPGHYESGWHATATFGTFGATAAAANLLDLDAAATVQALNVAASMPAGLKRNFGSMTKPLHAGLAARSGVTAARLAADGFTAGETAISGERGFWDRYGPTERAAFSPTDGFALEEGIRVKAYPCCYFTHAAISAVASMVDDGVDPEAIERIEVSAAGGARDALAYTDPTTTLQAKFSMEYTVARAATDGRVGLAAFEPGALDDPDVQRLRERVSFTVDDTMPYDANDATVRIDADGETHERHQADPPGSPAEPLSDAALGRKFRECAGRAFDDATVRDLHDVFATLPEHVDVATAIAGVT